MSSAVHWSMYGAEISLAGIQVSTCCPLKDKNINTQYSMSQSLNNARHAYEECFARSHKSYSAGLHQPGGTNGTTTSQIFDCFELTKLRYQEVVELLEQSIQAASDEE